MRRLNFFFYGLACYAMFLGVFLYAIGFLGNLVVPRTIDDGFWTAPAGVALLVNVGLLVLFGLQHSIMARPTFKRWWTRLVPNEVERSTYVLFSNLCLIALYVLWQPMPAVLWEATGAGAMLMWGLFAFGWLTVLLTTLLINHFDLFGLRQVWLQLRGKPYTPIGFRKPAVYRFVRHPLYVGWLLAFWATPTMTVGHLVFALGMTAYILVAIRFEERNLLEEHGASYAEYRRTTPMLIPRLSPSFAEGDQAATAPAATS